LSSRKIRFIVLEGFFAFPESRKSLPTGLEVCSQHLTDFQTSPRDYNHFLIVFRLFPRIFSNLHKMEEIFSNSSFPDAISNCVHFSRYFALCFANDCTQASQFSRNLSFRWREQKTAEQAQIKKIDNDSLSISRVQIASPQLIFPWACPIPDDRDCNAHWTYARQWVLFTTENNRRSRTRRI
jgi:hypothetical protein